MTRALVILSGEGRRKEAANLCRIAPPMTQVEFRAPKRTLPQNARQWALLTIIARNVEWHGQRLSADDWKLIFMYALNREVRIVPAIDGRGFVNLGTSTSRLSKEEHSDLTTLIEKFAAERGIALGDMP